MDHLVGIDLGGTNIKAGLLALAPDHATGVQLLEQSSCRTKVEKGFHHVIEQMADAVRALCERRNVPLTSLKTVGIGCPGPVDVQQGVVMIAPNFPGWRDLPVRDTLRRRLGGLPTFIENDANAAAYGEFRAGAGRGCRSLVLITLGTGIGCGIVIDGRMHRGQTYTAGELGHVVVRAGGRRCGCGRSGCLETYASAAGTVARFREALAEGRSSLLIEGGRQADEITARDVFDAAADGDALAWEIVDETARYLAIGCDVVVNLIDPDVIVFSGGMAAAGDLLIKPVEKYARDMFFARPQQHTRLMLTELGGDAGIIGAALCALNASETSAS